MAWEDVWPVLKWVLAALAAGFVGQFGRVLAMRIIERRRISTIRSEQTDGLPVHRERSETDDRRTRDNAKVIKAESKLEKKRAKAAAKGAKKSANDESSQSP